MKNIEKYKSLLETGEVDALLLTSEYNRLYAAQYSIAEGVAVVTKDARIISPTAAILKLPKTTSPASRSA